MGSLFIERQCKNQASKIIMEELQHIVCHKTNDYPTGLKSVSEVADSIGGITTERILELAESGYLPHYRVDYGEPKFKISEVKSWIASNLISRCAGRALPDAIRIVLPAPEVVDRPPVEISNIPNLQQIPKHGYQPGVYFLCKGDSVVYVGQSVSPASRVSTHGNDKQKDFDRVYLLPVPQSELNDVEAAFIHHLLPSGQGGIRQGREKPLSPRMSKPKDEILSSVGVVADE